MGNFVGAIEKVYEHLSADCPDSELDEVLSMEEVICWTRSLRFANPRFLLDTELQWFCAELSSSKVDPDVSRRPRHDLSLRVHRADNSILTEQDSGYLEHFVMHNSHFLKSDASLYQTAREYADHWKFL